MTFEKFKSIPRLTRDCIISEKVDGTNAQLHIEDGILTPGSRNRYISLEEDNYGFADWAYRNEDVLKDFFGVGRHFGEWCGHGIQRGYGLDEKYFYLFNSKRWNNTLPQHILDINIRIVPVLYEGIFCTGVIDSVMLALKTTGSYINRGYMKPEGVIVYHKAGNFLFKKTFENDEKGKQ